MRLLELVLLAIFRWVYQKAKACQGLNIARSAAQKWSKISERMEVDDVRIKQDILYGLLGRNETVT